MCSSSYQALVHKNGSHECLLAFLILEVLPVFSSKRGQTLFLWFPPHMMDYDVYMHDIIGLVIIFETSLRS